MKQDENLLLIYSIGGDSKDQIRISLIKGLNALNEPDPDAIQALPGTSISVLYFLDADKIGTARRMAQVIEECKEAFPNVAFKETYDPSTFHEFEDITLVYMFFDKRIKMRACLKMFCFP